MKKSAAIVMATVIGALCVPVIVGCDAKQQETFSDDLSYVSLADFEQWGPDFQMLRIYNNFGKITRNKDEKYIKEGNYSAKLQPVGETLKKSAPTLCIPTKSTFFEYDYQDFSKYDEVSAHLYNASDKPIDVTVGLVSSITSSTTIQTVPGDTITLQPNKWQRIDYWISHNVVSLSTDVTKIEGVYFQFPNQGVSDPDDAPSIYLDDVRLRKSESGEIKDLIVLDTFEVDGETVRWELCDFEKPYQKYVFRSELSGLPQQNFECSVVKASDYGVLASSGENVLRVVRHPSENFGQIYFSERIMQKLGMDKIPETEWKSTYLCFDVYSAGTGTDYTTFQFSTAGGKGRTTIKKIIDTEAKAKQMGKRVGDWVKWAEGHYFSAKGWSTYRISLFEIAHQGENYVKNPGPFNIWMNAYTGSSDVDWYFDNFRMEKGTELFVREDAV